MVAGAGEPSAKRAKVDEAKEEEDPLVRRKEEVVRLLERASAKGKSDARAKKELLTLCADFETKNEKHLRRLLPEQWQKILDEYLEQNDLLALAMTCRFFRDTTKGLSRKLETNLHEHHLLKLRESGKMPSHSLGWFQWVCATFKFVPGYEMYSLVPKHFRRVNGAGYEGELVNYAAFRGSVEILRWLIEEKGCESNWLTGQWAGRGGSVDVLEYLWRKRYDFTRGDACGGAAGGGHLEALKFLRGLDPPSPWSEGICLTAARGGHLDVLKWLRAQEPPCPWSTLTCTFAAEGGHLEVLQWAREQDPPCPWSADTCTYAAKGGHLDVLKWLRAQDPPCPWGVWTCAWAARGGHLEVLKWLRDQDPPCPWNETTCSEAAYGGHLNVLTWLRSQDPPCPWDEWTCTWAAQRGQLEVLKWVRSQDPPCPWDEKTCEGAAARGDLEALKFLRGQDPPCPWDEKTCEGAAVRGDLEVLKFLRGQDPPCPWVEKTCEGAARGGHLEALKFLRGQDPPCPWVEKTCEGAARGGHLEALKFLRGLDPPCPWDEKTCEWAARGGRLDILKWARSQDPPCPWSRSGCRRGASEPGHQHMVQWIRSHCRREVTGYGPQDIVQWIDQQEEEEEDALVRRREELALGFANTWAKGKELGARLVREAEEERYSKAEGERLVREAKERAILESDRTLREARLSFGQELRSVCAKLEAKNEKLLGRLPPEIWQKILDDYLHQNDFLTVALTCRFFREKQKDLGKKLETNLKDDLLLELRKSGKMPSHTLGWFQWVCDYWEILPSCKRKCFGMVEDAVYKGVLLNYAAFQGSVKILRWLVEEKGWKLNKDTGSRAGLGGSVEVLEYLKFMGYKFDVGLQVRRCKNTWNACDGAARGGHLKALEFLRGLDPPCHWDESTSFDAARGGHLEVLKWARSQDPPCPWDEDTCVEAARGGHLEVLKWARSQDPPCPWGQCTCSKAALGGHLDVLKWVRGQDPPCPWEEYTCALAAVGGHLEVLKWARSQDPPCPWSRSDCRRVASDSNHQHIVKWIDQQEDESDPDFKEDFEYGPDAWLSDPDFEDWMYSDTDSDINW